MITHTEKHYAAFISYAHADEVMAARLHKALETFPVPKALRAKGKTTKPVFRDVAELTAAHSLSEKIRDAVQGSRVLIVLCSPAAKASHWVNEEIRLFRELHGDAAILSAIIDGTPETAFPKALTEGGREPLAAALGSDKAGFKLGVTQLAAGMLGTGLDDLIQRGAKRRQRIMATGLAALLLFSGAMGFTAWQAVEARNEAQTARGEAEGLVEYMIKDLKFKLEPVGRLDLLQGIGDKAVEYYDKQDIKSLNDDSLNRQAAARQVLAQVHLDAGRMDEAQAEIEAAADLTREVLERNPDDTDAIFAHAQSEYWVGAYYQRQGKREEKIKPFKEYDRLAQRLYEIEPTNFDWVMEAAWGKNNLAWLARETARQASLPDAFENYTQSIRLFKEAIILKPEDKIAQTELANAMSGKASILLANSSAEDSRSYHADYLNYIKTLSAKYPTDLQLKKLYLISQINHYERYFLEFSDNEYRVMSKALDELLLLIDHDPTNFYNIDYFIRAIFYSSDKIDVSHLKTRKTQVKKLIEGLPASHNKYKNYYNTMLEILFIKTDVSIKSDTGYLKNLNALTMKILKQDNYDDYWRVLYAVYLLNIPTDDTAQIKAIAKRYLEIINKRTDVSYPNIINQKINIYASLEDCNSMALLLEPFKARGYHAIRKVKSNACSIIQENLTEHSPSQGR